MFRKCSFSLSSQTFHGVSHVYFSLVYLFIYIVRVFVFFCRPIVKDISDLEHGAYYALSYNY